MKKAAVVTVAALSAMGLLVGIYQKEETAVGPLVAQAKEEIQSKQPQPEEDPLIPEIDTDLALVPGTRVAVVSKNVSGQYWELVKKGMNAAIQDVNAAYGFKKDDAITMTFEGPDDEHDVEGQINTLDAVLAENPSVLCLSASDMDSCQAQLETAAENDIPVIAFDSNVSETDLVLAYRGTDNTYVGKLAAKKLAKAIGKQGKVAVFSVQEKTQSVKQRTEGFLKQMEKYPEIEVVEVVYQDQVEDMAAKMQEVLTQHPDLAGVCCTNEDMSELYLGIEKDKDAPRPMMVGVDATSPQQKAIKAGEEIGVVSQNPYAIGYQTIWTALMATDSGRRDEIEKNVLLEPMWINQNNMESPAVSGYLYGK